MRPEDKFNMWNAQQRKEPISHRRNILDSIIEMQREAYIAGHEQASHDGGTFWISVKERLPEPWRKTVWVNIVMPGNNDKRVFITSARYNGTSWVDPNNPEILAYPSCKITHWTPMIAPGAPDEYRISRPVSPVVSPRKCTKQPRKQANVGNSAQRQRKTKGRKLQAKDFRDPSWAQDRY